VTTVVRGRRIVVVRGGHTQARLRRPRPTTARRGPESEGADRLPSSGDTIRLPQPTDPITLSGGDEIDARVLAQIDRMQAEELGSDEGDREGYERLEVPGDDPSTSSGPRPRRRQKVAIGLTGEPVPPTIGSGATVSRNSRRSS